MKVLVIDRMHFKNRNALLNYKQLELTIIDDTNLDEVDLTQFDCVYSPSRPVEVCKYPGTKFIFGPQFSVFPEEAQLRMIPNTVYVQPSNWACQVWKDNPLCNSIRIEPLPFGVDVNRFTEIKPVEQRTGVVLYSKRRRPEELTRMVTFLESKGFAPRIFDYVAGYDETEYTNALQNARFGVWMGAHESQGFALEEALSCNVPLFVWSVTSMNQEYGCSYHDIKATTIPYWDERCGEYFHQENELEQSFSTFISKLNTYKPREYVLETLTYDACEKRLIDLIETIQV